MADTDWVQTGLTAAVALATGTAGLLAGIWRWGRRDANRENSVKADYGSKIDKLREELRSAMAAASLVRGETADEFRDTFAALRQKINDVELETERRFVDKDDFKNFVKEYREDTRDIKSAIANLTRNQ